jgi:phosphoglycolate phosphatase
MKYKCVIFDCDGTLVDTLEDISAAMNRALAIHGFPPAPVEKYRDMVGWGIIRLAELALPKEARVGETVETVAASAKAFMDGQPLEQCLSRPYPGIRELVAELSREKKIKTAVISNKPDSVLRRLMDDLFSPRASDAVYGLRPKIPAKPDPSAVWELLAEFGISPHDAVFMGDSEIDMETAKNAGCYPLGVSWGFRSRATLEKAGAARIIDRPDAIWELIKGNR